MIQCFCFAKPKVKYHPLVPVAKNFHVGRELGIESLQGGIVTPFVRAKYRIVFVGSPTTLILGCRVAHLLDPPRHRFCVVKVILCAVMFN